MRSDPRTLFRFLTSILYPIEHNLLVMPFLRLFHKPPFHCHSESVEALRQILHGCKLNPSFGGRMLTNQISGSRIHA